MHGPMRTRCLRSCIRCARASLPAPASPASGFLPPSCSRTPWTGTSRGSLRRTISGRVKRVVPFLKVDKGLAAEKDGVQLMKPMSELGALLNKAKAKNIFGTKMRSVIKQANGAGINNIVNQQFEAAQQIIAAGLVPIIEPEVDIRCPG